MKNASFILAYCLIIVCSIFKFCSNVTFAEAILMPIVTATPLPPTVSTGEATFDYSGYILTLTGTVNAHGFPTEALFQYGTVSNSYSSMTSTQTVNGTNDTAVIISVPIDELAPNETGILYYYYRIAAKNDLGTSYGEEKNIGLTTPIIDCLCAVSGIVTDAVSKEGIGNAAVGSSEGLISYTGTSGYYTWDNGIIPCYSGGTYDLTASAEGYLSLTQPIYVEPCIEGTRDFELQPITTPAPTVTPTPWLITEDATNITSSSAALNATVPLVVGYIYFEYGTASGSYNSSVDVVREDTSDKVSAAISGLSPATTYFDRVVVFEKPPGGYTYGNEKSFTTLSAATPTGTPTPVCEAESIKASSQTLKLEREESDDVTVTVAGSEGCPVVGETVTAKIKSGKKRISVTPLSQNTNANGNAMFTIMATKKASNARVKFETASGLKTTVTVTVRR